MRGQFVQRLFWLLATWIDSFNDLLESFQSDDDGAFGAEEAGDPAWFQGLAAEAKQAGGPMDAYEHLWHAGAGSEGTVSVPTSERDLNVVDFDDVFEGPSSKTGSPSPPLFVGASGPPSAFLMSGTSAAAATGMPSTAESSLDLTNFGATELPASEHGSSGSGSDDDADDLGYFLI